MEDSDESKLFVGGISWQTTDYALKEHFGKYGTVAACVIARDRNTGAPRGFGFVCFSDPCAVDKALKDSHEILGRTVEVKKAIPRSEHPQNQQHSRGLSGNGRNNVRSNDQFRTKKIFVGGLSANLTEKEFKSYFEKYGRITDVVVMHDNMTHRPRGFGFITFDLEEAVENVVQNSFHELGGKLVEVKRAVPKDGNSNSGNGYNARCGSGRQPTLDNYQNGNFPFYNGPNYGMLPGYGPFSRGGSVLGYAYGGAFAGGYPTGGYSAIGYGVAPVAPSNPWNCPLMVGVQGSPLPYGSDATVYPAYVSGGVGLMGAASYGFSGNVGMGVNRKLSEVSGLETHGEADIMSSHNEKGSMGVNSSGSGRNYNAAASKQNHKGNDGRRRPCSDGKYS